MGKWRSPSPHPSHFARVVWEMEMRQYPKVWWSSHLQKLRHTVTGARPWRELVAVKPWLVPVPAPKCVCSTRMPNSEPMGASVLLLASLCVVYSGRRTLLLHRPPPESHCIAPTQTHRTSKRSGREERCSPVKQWWWGASQTQGKPSM